MMMHITITHKQPIGCACPFPSLLAFLLLAKPSCNSYVHRQISLDTNGDNKLPMASFQTLGGHGRCSDAHIIVVTNGEKLPMSSFQALGGHRRFSNADVVFILDTNGEKIPMASFQFQDLHRRDVQSVWRGNCTQVFERFVSELGQPRRHLYIAFDVEYVADASTDVRSRPICWNTGYEHLRAYVNGGDVLQVGLALAFDDLERHCHGGAGAPAPSSPRVITLEINLKFDVDAREYNDASLAFLADQGHCLAKHRDRGVTTEQFVDGLLRHLPFCDDSVTWVTFHGDRDFGFLLRLLHPVGRRGVLPPDRAAFMRQVRRQFPVFYDVRVLGQLEQEGFTGGLTALAARLGVRRTGGEHHAGSDALLTLSCFNEIRCRNKHQLQHRLETRQCLLSGMEEFDMAIKCARHIDDATVIIVEVQGHNFQEEARRIDELVRSSFKIVGVHVQLPHLGWGIPFYAANYELIKSSLKGVDEFQVTVGFMNAEGMLAYGRLWKFYLRCSNNAGVDLAGHEDGYVHRRRLAWLMASCGATHNSNVTWVTYQGSHEIACLIKSFLAADDLPSDWRSYIEHQSGVFPNLCDVGLIAQGCPEIGKDPLGLGMLLEPQALFVLRCYKRLAESPWFPHIAEAFRGAAYGQS